MTARKVENRVFKNDAISLDRTEFSSFFVFLGVSKWSFRMIFIGFTNVSATPINRASGAFRDRSSWANSGDSNLLIILVDFKDFRVLGGL